MSRSKLLISSIAGVVVLAGALVAFNLPTGRALDSGGGSAMSANAGFTETPQAEVSPKVSTPTPQTAPTQPTQQTTYTPSPTVTPVATPTNTCVTVPNGQQCSGSDNTTSFNMFPTNQ